MTIQLYFDEDSVRKSLVESLRARGLDVTTAYEAGMIGRDDHEHLDYATETGRVLFSFNRGDFYRIHTEYLEQNKSHAGIVLANQQEYSVGEQMRRILRLSAAKTADEMKNWVEFLGVWG